MSSSMESDEDILNNILGKCVNFLHINKLRRVFDSVESVEVVFYLAHEFHFSQREIREIKGGRAPERYFVQFLCERNIETRDLADAFKTLKVKPSDDLEDLLEEKSDISEFSEDELLILEDNLEDDCENPVTKGWKIFAEELGYAGMVLLLEEESRYGRTYSATVGLFRILTRKNKKIYEVQNILYASEYERASDEFKKVLEDMMQLEKKKQRKEEELKRVRNRPPKSPVYERLPLKDSAVSSPTTPERNRPPKSPVYERIPLKDSAVSSPTTPEHNVLLPELPPRNTDNVLLPELPPRNTVNLVSPDYQIPPRNTGIRLSSFRHRHRKMLSRILDLRGDNIENNWLELGKYIASHDKILEERVDRCHECYYGGGSATLAMFWQLSMKQPFLKVGQFRATALRLKRHDIAQYMTKHNINNELLFFEIQDRHKTDIAFALERRKEVENDWPDFADAFGFSPVDIAHFQEKKKTKQKYSPTSELIILLITHRPEITIDELQMAAIAINRRDAYNCLEEIAQDLAYVMKTSLGFGLWD